MKKDNILKDALEQFPSLLFTNQEFGISHNPYDQELWELTSIEDRWFPHFQACISPLFASMHFLHSGGILPRPFPDVSHKAPSPACP